MKSPKNLFVLPYPSHLAQQNIPSDQTPELWHRLNKMLWIWRSLSVFYYLEITIPAFV